MSRPIITPVTRPVVTLNAAHVAPELVPEPISIIEDTTPAVLCDTCGVNHSNFLGMNTVQLEGLRDTMNYSVRVPVVAPVRPERTEMGGFHFRVENMTPAEKYATGINLCRQRNVASGVVCGICGEDECQGTAGNNWYGIFGWIACHMHCWQDLVWRYHQYCDEQGEFASMHGFVRFIAD